MYLKFVKTHIIVNTTIISWLFAEPRSNYLAALEGIDFSNPEHIFDFSAGPLPKKTISFLYKGKPAFKQKAKPSVLLSKLEILPPDKNGEVRVCERKFQCQLCGDKFHRSTHLSRHMRLHTGHRPYTCHICKRKFARCDYKQAHVLQHRRDKVHNCPVCGEVYHDLTSYANHCQTHPDDEYVRLCRLEDARKAQTKITTNNIKPSTTDQPVAAADAKELAYDCEQLKEKLVDCDTGADITIIPNPFYRELPPNTSAPIMSVSTAPTATNNYCSLHNAHPMSPAYILVSPSEQVQPTEAFMYMNYQIQPPLFLVAS